MEKLQDGVYTTDLLSEVWRYENWRQANTNWLLNSEDEQNLDG